MFKRIKAQKVPSSAAMELPAVKTTIVGGRPPGSGKPLGPIPRGIEVLVKKASVDPAFKALLVQRRSRAADEIGLLLEDAEAMMLDIVPPAQLEAIITQTRVEPSKKPAFLGKAAAVMLVALGASAVNAQRVELRNGVRDERPATTAPADPNRNPVAPVAGAAVSMPPRERPTTRPTTQASQPATQLAIPREEVDKLIAQLDDNEFQVRKAAQDKLTDLGQAVVPALKQAIKSGGLSLEARTRAETIINKLSPTPSPRPQIVEGVRPMPIEVAGAMADVPPPKLLVVAGDVADRPATQPVTRAASQPATRPATQPAAPTEIHDSKGVRPDRPASEPPLGPAPAMEATAFTWVGSTATTGNWTDAGNWNEATQPASRPATQPSQPASAPAPKRADLGPLLKQLDADDFKVRAAAQQKLQDLGLTALPALREASKDQGLSLEVRTRVKAVVAKLRASTRPVQPARPDDIMVVNGIRAVAGITPAPPADPDDSDD
ncbi:MAG: hypothetical protein ACE15C_13950 [Phycisphaerae bacterium]